MGMTSFQTLTFKLTSTSRFQMLKRGPSVQKRNHPHNSFERRKVGSKRGAIHVSDAEVRFRTGAENREPTEPNRKFGPVLFSSQYLPFGSVLGSEQWANFQNRVRTGSNRTFASKITMEKAPKMGRYLK